MALTVKTNVALAVKEASKKKNYSVKSISEDFTPALESKVAKIVEQAVERAQSNNRRTVMGKDV